MDTIWTTRKTDLIRRYAKKHNIKIVELHVADITVNDLMANIKHDTIRPCFETSNFSIYNTFEGYFVVANVNNEVVVRGPWNRATGAIVEGLLLTL